MNVLIVGGAGYVGGAITDLLIKKKYSITVYDNLLYEEQFMKNCNFIYGDIREENKLKKIFKKFDAVIWAAALVGDGACNINPRLTNKLNFDSVKFLKKNFKKKIIFFSTCSVYGAQNDILSETSPTNPLSLYALTKLKSEKILENTDATIFRLGTLFGLSDQFSRIRMDLVVNTLTARAYLENKIYVYGGEQYRPLLHVKDVARAVHCALKYKKTKGIYNLSLGNYKIFDLARDVKKHFKKLVVIKQPMPFQDTRNYKVNNSKSIKELKFKAKITVEQGVLEIKKLLTDKRIKNVNSPRYTNQKYLEVFSKNEKI
jgi:nucleoside-diphosphate-sugar epimerase